MAIHADPGTQSLSPARETAALVLAHGGTQQEAARVANTTDRSIRRWLNEDEEFRALVHAYRAHHVRELERRLGEMQSDALDTLHDLLDAKHPASVRHGAARTILDFGARAREESSMTRRIAALEEIQLDIIDVTP
jgi:hypothetical protein